MRRTVIAALLTATGVIVPCTAWYVAGSRAVSEQAARLAAASRDQARLEAAHVAQQIALRLESLRESESRRPIQEYTGGEPIALGDCQIEPLSASTLARGPADPLIWAHFQIDEVGVLTLPTLADGSGGSGSSADSLQQAILNELECASSQHLAALRRSPDTADRRRLVSPQGAITVGSFSWHTSSVENAPALVALREVSTPAAVLTQGFVVPVARLDSLLAGSIHPASIRPGLPTDESGARVPVLGDAWTVEVDASESVERAALESRRLVVRFRRTFVIGALAATLAGVALVSLVFQSERVARERARFAAAAAHELRTPLAGLQLYGEMLAQERGDPERRRLYARRVANEVERLGRVVANVLGFSRLERGGLALSVRAGDLEQAVRSSLEHLGPAIASGGARVELTVDAELPHAWFDADAVHQILQNLLDNAEKFSRDCPDRTIRVSLTVDGEDPALIVRDRGRGVDPELRRSLFRPFSRGSETGSPAGLGIGLALVCALVEEQGASIVHRRPDGGGAEFEVRFRRADLEAAGRPPGEAS